MSINSAANTAADNARSARAGFSGRYRKSRRLTVFLLGLLLSGSQPAIADHNDVHDCLAADVEPVSIRHVHDGDTVVRGDGERIRLIGIDTPELARDDRPAEALSSAARDLLRSLIDGAGTLRARYGPEPRDDYGRLLAHLYADGRNLQAELLAAGLATPLFIAPNLAHLDCYQQAAATARASRRGLWALPQYQPRPPASLHDNARGYRIVHGAVQRIGRSRCCIWLNLDDDFALRIERENLPLFEEIDFNRLKGQRLEARGYVYRRNDQLRMHLRHPADMVIGD